MTAPEREATMPIPLSPNDKFELILESDMARDADGKPLAVQPPETPRFFFRHLSGREQRTLAEMLDTLETSEKTAVAIDRNFETLRFLLVGWSSIRDPLQNGQEIPYNPDRVEDVLQYQEAQELVYGVFGWRPNVNFYASQSSTPSSGSAPPANAESA